MYCLASFCCVCLKDSVKLQDINQLDIDDLPLINKIIFVSFGHEAIDFQVVKHICLDCTQTLRLAYTFKRSCLVNHELLRVYSGQLKYFTGQVSHYQDCVVSLEQLPEKSVEVVDTKENKVNENDNNNKISESPTEESTTASSSSQVNKQKNEVPVFKKYACTFCDIKFNRLSLLKIHINRHKSILVKNLNKKINPVALERKHTGPFICSVCSKELSSLHSLNRHLHIHADLNKILCKFCHTKLPNFLLYKKHIVKRHGNRDALLCNICNLTLENYLDFAKHMLKHCPKTCKYCKQKFYGNFELEKHIASNHKLLYKCSVCGKPFNTEKCMRVHLKLHKITKKNVNIKENPLKIKPEKKINTIHSGKQENNSKKELEMKTSQNSGKGLGIRKKCKNCLCIFSSGQSLNKHKCFKLKNMFQCNMCAVVYSKKESFIKHVKNCTSVIYENIGNTPELQEFEKQIVEKNHLEFVDIQVEGKIIKDEDDLVDIKEELLDDFLYNAQTNQKENAIEISEVYSISKFENSQIELIPNENKYDLYVQLENLPINETSNVLLPKLDETTAPTRQTNKTPNAKIQKKKLPNIKLIEKHNNNLDLETNSIAQTTQNSNKTAFKRKSSLDLSDNEHNYSSAVSEICVVKLRKQNDHIPPETENPDISKSKNINSVFIPSENVINPSVNGNIDKFKQLIRRKFNDLNLRTETRVKEIIHANTGTNDFSNNEINSKLAEDVAKTVTNPLIMDIFSDSNISLETTTTINTKLTESINKNLVESAKIISDNTSHISKRESTKYKNNANETELVNSQPYLLESNYKSIINNDPEITENKQTNNFVMYKKLLDEKSKSINATHDSSESKNFLSAEVSQVKSPNKLEPIILKTRRSIKHNIKKRRKIICDTNPDEEPSKSHTTLINNITSELNSKSESFDFKQNVKTESTKFVDSETNSLDPSSTTFILETLRRKSINISELSNIDENSVTKNITEENDSSYITVRKVSDINNDI